MENKIKYKIYWFILLIIFSLLYLLTGKILIDFTQTKQYIEMLVIFVLLITHFIFLIILLHKCHR